MDKKLSFLFLAGTLGNGGAEKQLYLLSKTLLGKSHKVSVISFGNDEYWEKEIKNLDIPTYSIKSSNRLIRIIKLIILCFILKPDIFYSYHFYTSSYVGFVGKLFSKIKSIGSVRSDGFSEVKANGYWSKFHMGLPDLIIGNSKQGLEAIGIMLCISPNKLNYIPNSIELLKINTIKASKNSEIIKLIYVGRLVVEKNPEMFVQICNELNQKKIKFTAEIYGDGILKQTLIELIHKYHLNDIVQICGIKPNISNDLVNYDLLISTSNFEGSPNVLLESINSEICFFAFKNESTIEFTKKFQLNDFLFDDLSQVVELCSNFLRNNYFYLSQIKEAKIKLDMYYSTESQYNNLINLLK